MLLCIDIGNTHTHYGLIVNGQTVLQRHLDTRMLEHRENGLAAILADLVQQHRAIKGIVFCSVVPQATEQLLLLLQGSKFPAKILELTYKQKLGVRIGYPKPKEIGADRLANAAAAQILYGAPALVIDMGTAVTFDIITKSRGYEGGIIAPGVELMRRYLHEQTALLPLLDDSIEIIRAIGQSTAEAMRIGAVIGFGGMIQALLDAVIEELAARGESLPRILATGGSAPLLQARLRHPFIHVPDLTLRGLAAIWHLNQK